MLMGSTISMDVSRSVVPGPILDRRRIRPESYHAAGVTARGPLYSSCELAFLVTRFPGQAVQWKGWKLLWPALDLSLGTRPLSLCPTEATTGAVPHVASIASLSQSSFVARGCKPAEVLQRFGGRETRTLRRQFVLQVDSFLISACVDATSPRWRRVWLPLKRPANFPSLPLRLNLECLSPAYLPIFPESHSAIQPIVQRETPAGSGLNIRFGLLTPSSDRLGLA
jgi:hypothetical protein